MNILQTRIDNAKLEVFFCLLQLFEGDWNISWAVAYWVPTINSVHICKTGEFLASHTTIVRAVGVAIRVAWCSHMSARGGATV
jgi:hypothetical protein